MDRWMSHWMAGFLIFLLSKWLTGEIGWLVDCLLTLLNNTWRSEVGMYKEETIVKENENEM